MSSDTAQHRLLVPGLREVRTLAFEVERSIQQGDAVGALARIALTEHAFKGVSQAYASFHYLFAHALVDLNRRIESPGFKGIRVASAPSITAIIALVGPRFLGREIVAQYGGPCAVCGDPCVRGTLIVYDDATKKVAHTTCGELASGELAK